MIISVINSFVVMNNEKVEITFPCSSCGACCRRIGQIISSARAGEPETTHPYLSAFLSFPYQIEQDGRCSMLNADNKCSVYHERPAICNIKDVWYQFFKDSGRYMNVNAFYIHNVKVCNELMIVDNMDAKYFIDIGSI